MGRIKDSLSELEINQMEAISKLQDIIKLKKFDISENKKQINTLKNSLLNKKKLIKLAIKELEKIKKEKTYGQISNVITILNSSFKKKQ